jgi:hypothetical protein
MGDDQEQQHDQMNGYTLLTRGRFALMQLYIEGMAGIDEEMAGIGFSGLSSVESRERTQGHPVFPGKAIEETKAYELRTEDLIAIVAFIQEPLVKATIEVLATKFLEVVLPRFSKIFTHAKKESDIQYPMTISSAFFFSREQVQITAIATLKEPPDREVAFKLFPLAFEKGVNWLEKNGRRGRYLTFRIVDGNIDAFPIISNQPVSF